MAKVYAHIVIADELLRKIVDPKVLDFASEGAPPEHRDEARKQIQLALARGARERLQEAIVLWKTQPVPIPNDPALTNIVDLASQLRSKEGTVIASEAIPMAQQCEACAVRLQQKFGNDPLSRP
jgi:hypothetical protein